MERFIDGIARLVRAYRRAYERKGSFFTVFAFLFVGMIALLGALDLLPQVVSVSETGAGADTPAASVAVAELPTRIGISTLELSADVANPATTDIATLDKELLKGAVRYPTSARLGETGNVVLFGHSSYLPVIHNQAYKTFNGIQKLALGDTITVYSSITAYTYRVRSVSKESADANSAIPLAVAGKTLTLVTCNSFGTKVDRFVVVADFVESRPAGI